jgi:uncharacterized membrane-anchored protein
VRFWSRNNAFSPGETGADPAAYQHYRAQWTWSGLVLIACIVLGGQSEPAWLGITAIAISFAAVAAMMYAFVRYVAAWDEFQRALMLNASAVALSVTVLVLMANAVLGAHSLPSIAPKHLPFVPLAVLFVAFFVARRRAR